MASRNARRRKAKAKAQAKAEARAKAQLANDRRMITLQRKSETYEERVWRRQVKSSITMVQECMPRAKGGGFQAATRRGRVAGGKFVPDYGFLPRFSQK